MVNVLRNLKIKNVLDNMLFWLANQIIILQFRMVILRYIKYKDPNLLKFLRTIYKNMKNFYKLKTKY